MKLYFDLTRRVDFSSFIVLPRTKKDDRYVISFISFCVMQIKSAANFWIGFKFNFVSDVFSQHYIQNKPYLEIKRTSKTISHNI